MSTGKIIEALIIEALQESSNMKEFVAVFWRGNPQLKNGGYETERTIEAKTLKAAEKKAKEIEKKVAYGSMSLLRVEEKETVQESPNFKSRLEKIENLANEDVEEGSNFKSRLEKLDKMANESKVTEDGVPNRKQYSVDEDRWVTIKGTHVLINNKGEIKDEKLRKEIDGNSDDSEKVGSSVITTKVKNKKLLKSTESLEKRIENTLEKGESFDYVGWDIDNAREEEHENIDNMYAKKISKEAENVFSSSDDVEDTIITCCQSNFLDNFRESYKSNTGEDLPDDIAEIAKELVNKAKKYLKSKRKNGDFETKRQVNSRKFREKYETHNSKHSSKDEKRESIKKVLNSYVENSDKEIETYRNKVKDLTDFANYYAKYFNSK